MTTLAGMPETASQASELSTNPLAELAEAERLKTLATWVNSEYKKCKGARTAIERVWYRNMAFYYGDQWITVAPQNMGGQLMTPKAPPWRVRLTVNRIRPIIRTELARVTSQKPNASVVPASSDDEDLFAAQAGEQVWESLYRSKKMYRKFGLAMWWTLITGVGYTKQYWDPNMVDRDNNLKGDICYEAVTPFHVFVPDLREPDLENQSYVIHAFTKPLILAKQQFPQAFTEDSQPNVVASNEILDDAYLKIQANAKPDSVLFIEMWLKPGAHKDYPQGGMIQVVDTTVIAEHPNGIPYQHGEFPFTKYEHIPTGKFYSDSVIVDLIELQREYNRTRSQIIEAKNRMAKPQLMAPQGSVEARKITTEPGLLIEYKPGFLPPQPLPLQPIPAYVMQELDRTILDMEDLSAQHQVSKGNVPTGVTAATAISYLQERDDSVLTHTYDSVEQGLEKTAKQILSYAVQFWSVPRIVKVTGTDGGFDAMSLAGSQIASGTDVQMESGSSLPVSKAARQAFIMDMMKMGFIPPDQGLRIMEIGGVQKLYDQLQIDERQAQRENLRMKKLSPEEIMQHNMMREQFSMMQGAAAAGMEQQSIIPPELQDVLGAPVDASQPEDTGNLMDAQSAPPVDPTLMDTQSGMPLEPPTLVPVNTWDNHAVHVEVHNRFRKSQAFELLSEEHKALFEEHVQMHAMALNQAAMGAMMQGIGGPEMGIPPMSQSEGGLPPEDPSAQEGMIPSG